MSNVQSWEQRHQSFLEIPGSSRLEWWQQFLKDLSKKLVELGIGPQVRELLVLKIQAILDGENPIQVPKDPLVADTCAKQKQIRWEQLMLGRFAKEWGSHNHTQPGTERKSNKSWMTKVVYFIFTQCWKLWELHNQNWHGRDLATKQQAAAQQVK